MNITTKETEHGVEIVFPEGIEAAKIEDVSIENGEMGLKVAVVLKKKADYIDITFAQEGEKV